MIYFYYFGVLKIFSIHKLIWYDYCTAIWNWYFSYFVSLVFSQRVTIAKTNGQEMTGIEEMDLRSPRPLACTANLLAPTKHFILICQSDVQVSYLPHWLFNAQVSCLPQVLSNKQLSCLSSGTVQCTGELFVLRDCSVYRWVVCPQGLSSVQVRCLSSGTVQCTGELFVLRDCPVYRWVVCPQGLYSVQVSCDCSMHKWVAYLRYCPINSWVVQCK